MNPLNLLLPGNGARKAASLNETEPHSNSLTDRAPVLPGLFHNPKDAACAVLVQDPVDDAKAEPLDPQGGAIAVVMSDNSTVAMRSDHPSGNIADDLETPANQGIPLTIKGPEAGKGRAKA